MQSQKVETFDLSSLTDKTMYENILNSYEIIRTEFYVLKDGTPKVTIWYVIEEGA